MYYLEAQLKFWGNPKFNFDFESVKQTDCFITSYERDLRCSSRAYSLYALPRCLLGIFGR